MSFRSSCCFALLLLAGGCSGRATSSDPPAVDGGHGPGAAAPAAVVCDGAKAEGLLGAWLTYEDGSPNAAGEITPIPVRRTFCGTASSGTFRWLEDWVDPNGCRLIRDYGGTFTFDGHDLALTIASGFEATRCPGSDETRPVTEPQRPIDFLVVEVSADQLVLSDGSGHWEETYHRETVTHQ